MPKPTAGVRQSAHSAYCSDREKNFRTLVQSCGTTTAIAAWCAPTAGGAAA